MGGPGGGGVAFRLVTPPRITQVTRSNDVVVVTWSSFMNGVYQLELNTDPAANAWIPVGTQILGNVGTTTKFTAVQTEGKSFYRVALLPWLP